MKLPLGETAFQVPDPKVNFHLKILFCLRRKKTYPCDNLHNMLMLICNETSGWHFNISFSFKQLETTQMVETILRALL